MRNMSIEIKNYLKIFFVFHALFFVNALHADSEKALAAKGFALYEAEHYEEAIEVLTGLVNLQPEHADYHHTLAKSYGRQAEQVNWFKAMNYAKKTREHLEIAVDLKPDNVQYLDDLMDYYREAPSFLGGDKKKAETIRLRIEKLLSNDAHYYSDKAAKNNLDN